MRPLVCWVATGFGSGYAPIAPGTAGSLCGLLIYFPFVHLPLWSRMALLGALFVTGVYASGVTEQRLGRVDPPEVVIDEVAGMVLVLSLMPGAGWADWVGAFVLFRMLDVLKPYPAGWIQARMKGGWAIMLDDVVCALYAVLILDVIHWGLSAWAV